MKEKKKKKKCIKYQNEKNCEQRAEVYQILCKPMNKNFLRNQQNERFMVLKILCSKCLHKFKTTKFKNEFQKLVLFVV